MGLLKFRMSQPRYKTKSELCVPPIMFDQCVECPGYWFGCDSGDHRPLKSNEYSAAPVQHDETTFDLGEIHTVFTSSLVGLQNVSSDSFMRRTRA